MMEKFDFDKLPPEIAAVLRDVLNWRIARDMSQDAIAEQHIALLEESSTELRDWASNQGEMRYSERNVFEKKEDTKREARQKRIAASPLRRVKPED